MLHAGIVRDTFRFQHGGNRFLVGLFQLDLKGKTADTEGLAQKNINCNAKSTQQTQNSQKFKFAVEERPY